MASIRTLRFLVLLCAGPLQGQDVAFLAGVPTAQQVAQGLAVPSPRETAARRYAALFAFGNLVGSLMVPGSASPQAQERMASFDAMRNRVYEAEKQRDPVNYLLERCSQAYSESPAFQRELLDLYLSPAWQAQHGPRLDPRRWKAPLAMAPGAKVTAATLTPPMVEECGSVPAAAPSPTAAATPAERPVGRVTAEGYAYLKAGDTTRALAAFKASVATDPSEVLGYTGLGRIYTAQRQYSLSVAAWQEAASLVPGDWSVDFSLGVAYHGAKQYAEARDAYLMAMRAKLPLEFAGHLYEGLGAVYLELGQRDSAVAVYRTLVPIDTARASALAARIRKADQAVVASATARAAAAKPTVPSAEVEALRAEGKKHYGAEDYVKARASYEKLLRLSPNDGWGLYELGKSILMIEGADDTDSITAV